MMTVNKTISIIGNQIGIVTKIRGNKTSPIIGPMKVAGNKGKSKINTMH